MLLRHDTHPNPVPGPSELTRTPQDVKSAGEFYDDKAKDLGANIADLEKIIQGKTNSLRVVEEGELNFPFPIALDGWVLGYVPRVAADRVTIVLRQKMVAERQGEGVEAGGS